MHHQLDLWPQARAKQPLRWSVSRDKRLRTCARQYFLYHYASLGGGRAAAPAAIQHLYALKHLRNRFMLLGEVVHERLQYALQTLRKEGLPPQRAVLTQARARLRTHLAESESGAFWRRPGAATGLVEHAYGEPVDADAWLDLQARLQRCIANFYGLGLLQNLAQVPPYSWLALETFGSFVLAGATVVVKPDVAFRNPQGQVELVDWKSGAPSLADRAQLAVYGLYASRAWGQAPGPVRAHIAYLNHAHVDTFELDAAALQAAMQNTADSIARMQTLGQPAAAQRQPPESRFVPTLDARICARCVFRGACGAPAAQPFAQTQIAPPRRG